MFHQFPHEGVMFGTRANACKMIYYLFLKIDLGKITSKNKTYQAGKVAQLVKA